MYFDIRRVNSFAKCHWKKVILKLVENNLKCYNCIESWRIMSGPLFERVVENVV